MVSATNDITDEELMERVSGGETWMLGPLFERHHSRLFGFFLRMTGDRTASEDLVQDVFMRLLKYGGSYRGDRPFVPWLFSVARNAGTDHFRRAEPAADDAAEAEAAGALEAETPLPPEELEHDERTRRVRAALLRLPHDKREVLVLSRFRLLEYEEIGALLGCTVGAVKVRVHRALKDLRAVYRELESEAAR